MITVAEAAILKPKPVSSCADKRLDANQVPRSSSQKRPWTTGSTSEGRQTEKVMGTPMFFGVRSGARCIHLQIHQCASPCAFMHIDEQGIDPPTHPWNTTQTSGFELFCAVFDPLGWSNPPIALNTGHFRPSSCTVCALRAYCARKG